MLDEVASDGEAAVRRLSREFDGYDPDDFRVPHADLVGAAERVPDEVRGSIDFAICQVQRFAELQRATLQALMDATDLHQAIDTAPPDVRALLEALGEPYRKFSASRARLIPKVW